MSEDIVEWVKKKLKEEYHIGFNEALDCVSKTIEETKKQTGCYPSADMVLICIRRIKELNKEVK